MSTKYDYNQARKKKPSSNSIRMQPRSPKAAIVFFLASFSVLPSSFSRFTQMVCRPSHAKWACPPLGQQGRLSPHRTSWASRRAAWFEQTSWWEPWWKKGHYPRDGDPTGTTGHETGYPWRIQYNPREGHFGRYHAQQTPQDTSESPI